MDYMREMTSKQRLRTKQKPGKGKVLAERKWVQSSGTSMHQGWRYRDHWTQQKLRGIQSGCRIKCKVPHRRSKEEKEKGAWMRRCKPRFEVCTLSRGQCRTMARQVESDMVRYAFKKQQGHPNCNVDLHIERMKEQREGRQIRSPLQ